jgi:hypothetical protein
VSKCIGGFGFEQACADQSVVLEDQRAGAALRRAEEGRAERGDDLHPFSFLANPVRTTPG